MFLCVFPGKLHYCKNKACVRPDCILYVYDCLILGAVLSPLLEGRLREIPTDILRITTSMEVISYGQQGFVFKLGVERHGFALNLDV